MAFFFPFSEKKEVLTAVFPAVGWVGAAAEVTESQAWVRVAPVTRSCHLDLQGIRPPPTCSTVDRPWSPAPSPPGGSLQLFSPWSPLFCPCLSVHSAPSSGAYASSRDPSVTDLQATAIPAVAPSSPCPHAPPPQTPQAWSVCTCCSLCLFAVPAAVNVTYAPSPPSGLCSSGPCPAFPGRPA